MTEGHMECRVCHEREEPKFVEGVGWNRHCGEQMYGPYPPPPKVCIRKDHDHTRPWFLHAGPGHCRFDGQPMGHSEGTDDDCQECGYIYDAYIQQEDHS